ncbi:MAG TPA: HEAT repeat domain-containing protein [Candidatus Aminicenantes bacterium]|jgi:FOG: HEAT repeat|nr:HEAT repeat domain-containing protein [Acidobacteriota bacterium]MDD8039316.1 HEAT repeat domain-containing protein [Acidobacteriota bacterium]MDW3227690.1 HEAT repeat domain-containing protein [Acidobacteriota bacterium]HNQ81279.1 HEAT repeat domain-containing protein [Candidatus Aminicenantes bacterium]HNT32237.1 HEAT repeat domain-containing protein [Candidatus Aminicenantes bacterium]
MIKKTRIVLLVLALFLAAGSTGKAAVWTLIQDSVQAAEQAGKKARQTEQEARARALYEAAKKNVYSKTYEAAIAQFNDLAAKYAASAYGQEALYWLGYSLDKQAASLGDVKQRLEMQQAAMEHLETLMKDFPANAWVKDAKILQLQIAEELVRAGLGKYRRYIDQSVQEALESSLPVLEQFAVPPVPPIPPEPPVPSIPSKPLDPETELKLVALDALMGMDEEKAFPILEKMILSGQSPELREKALFILGQSDAAKVVPVLIQIAEKDASPKMRKSAIFWLGQRDEEQALAALIKIFETADAETKTVLLMAFAENKNPKGIAKITEIAKTEKDPEVRARALFWLGETEGEKAFPVLLESYRTTDNVQIKKQIIMALAQSQGPKAVSTLIDLAKKETNFDLKKQIVFWLGQSDSPEAAKFLQELIDK